MEAMTRRPAAFLLAFAFAMAGAALSFLQVRPAVPSLAPPSEPSTNSVHAPILIQGNGGFTGANGVAGGDGSAQNPYLIVGWEIDASTASGIDIRNTSAHVLIRDVRIRSGLAGTPPNDGVSLVNVTDTTILNTTLEGNRYGVVIDHSGATAIESTTAVNNSYGIVFLTARRSSVVNGTVSGNSQYGIYAFGSDNLVFRRNLVWANGRDGIYLSLSNDSSVDGNMAWAHAQSGITLRNSQRVNVTADRLFNNGYGFVSIGSSNVTLVDNTVENSTSYGIQVGASDGFRIYHSNFVNNTLSAFDDAGPQNSWDAGYPMGGNYWSEYSGVDNCSGPSQNVCPPSDGIGDTPFVVDSDTRDNYPLMTRSNTPPIAVLSVTPGTGNITTLFEADASRSSDVEDFDSSLQVRWDWEGNGTWDSPWSSEKAAGHRYADPGNYTVIVQVRDTAGATDQASYAVSVENTPPHASFTVDPSNGTVGTSFVLDPSSSDDLEDSASSLLARWDWENDGIWDTPWAGLQSVSHRYASVGNFTPNLQVKDTGGLVDRATGRVTVENTAPHAAFTLVPSSGTTSTVFTANASASSDAEDQLADLEVRWDWDGDGAWDTGWSRAKTAEHRYVAPGFHTVRLEVRDSGGLSSEDLHQVTVVSPPTSPDTSVFAWIAAALVVAVSAMAVWALYRRRKATSRGREEH